MKKFFRSLLLVFVIAFSGAAPSSAFGPNVPIPTGIELHPGLTKVEFKMCQVRRLFCGKTGIAIVAFSVFLLGIMIVDQKLSWPFALMLIIGMVVFINADKLARTFGKETWLLFEANPLCNCDCDETNMADWMDPSKWFKESGIQCN